MAHANALSRRALLVAGGIGFALAATGCTTKTSEPAASGSAEDAFFDLTAVHTVGVTFSDDDYQAMLDEYASSGEKTWISATVVIDGTTFEEAGLKLKGNSSLRSLTGDASSDASATQGPAAGGMGGDDGSVSADEPEGIPWLIRLDKYVDDREYDGRSDLVVRGNNTETSLNEAVALGVLEDAGVPAEQAAYVRFSVNGGDERLRLVLDLPDDAAWNDDTFGGTGATFKADSDGDYSYRGETADDYVDAFDAEFLGDDIDEATAFQRLGAFLEFVNDSSDEDFGSGLGDYLDVDAFAGYLAAQELIQNSDDIDGPGNNSYLHYDVGTGLMTVVAWDHNLAFGGMGAGGGPDGSGDVGGTLPSGMPTDLPTDIPSDVPTDGAGPGEGTAPDEGMVPDGAGGGFGGGMGGSNILSQRFLENDDFTALYTDALAGLTQSEYESGTAGDRLDALVTLLTDQASDLVDADTIEEEAQTIRDVIDGTSS